MMHYTLEKLNPIGTRSDDELEWAFEIMMAEAQSDTSSYGQIQRAEALAILAHIFRRRNRAMERE